MKEKIAKEMADILGWDWEKVWKYGQPVCRNYADQVLNVVAQEIEKVENPYGTAKRQVANLNGGTDYYEIDFHGCDVWEQCRQKILDLLNGI